MLGDALTTGTLVAFVLYIDRFFDPIRELAQRYNTFQATMAASERVFHLLDTKPDLLDAPGAVDLPPVKGQVAFKDVKFSVITSYSIHYTKLYDIHSQIV